MNPPFRSPWPPRGFPPSSPLRSSLARRHMPLTEVREMVVLFSCPGKSQLEPPAWTVGRRSLLGPKNMEMGPRILTWWLSDCEPFPLSFGIGFPSKSETHHVSRASKEDRKSKREQRNKRLVASPQFPWPLTVIQRWLEFSHAEPGVAAIFQLSVQLVAIGPEQRRAPSFP